MKLNTRQRIYIQTINKQKEKINKLEKKKEKVYLSYPKSMYSDDIRAIYLDDYNKKIEKCEAIISELRSKLD